VSIAVTDVKPPSPLRAPTRPTLDELFCRALHDHSRPPLKINYRQAKQLDASSSTSAVVGRQLPRRHLGRTAWRFTVRAGKISRATSVSLLTTATGYGVVLIVLAVTALIPRRSR
jgi:hypothetical protein